MDGLKRSFLDPGPPVVVDSNDPPSRSVWL